MRMCSEGQPPGAHCFWRWCVPSSLRGFLVKGTFAWRNLRRIKGARLTTQRFRRVAAMKLLLGSLLLVGACWVEAALDLPTMVNFQNQKIVGHWYPVANIFIEKQFPEYTLKITRAEGLRYSYKYHDRGQCKKRSFLLSDQGTPGIFKTKSPTHLQILDTDYKTYIISYVTRGMDSFLTLASKEKHLTRDLESTFSEYAASVGIMGEIVPMKTLEEC